VSSFFAASKAEALQAHDNASTHGRIRRSNIELQWLISGLRSQDDARLIQFTAAISPGSSGGGLFDAHGNLVAITSYSLKGAQGINFAIPAEDFWR
jgi:S1-C subfamily serine protease